MLRFYISPDDSNLQNQYFPQQPAVEVTDLGGNRVEQGMHAITLSLSKGAGRLRGPKVRYTRRGVVRFERLRIDDPGYDKVMQASSPGLIAGVSTEFGVVPNGIPHTLRFANSPMVPVITDTVLSGNATVKVELLDVYGVRVTTQPSLTLAKYLTSASAGSSRITLEDVCNAMCRANSYTVALKVAALDAPDNPHLRGSALTPITMEGGSQLAVDGLAEFVNLRLWLQPRDVSTRVQLRTELIAQREVVTYDVNGTASTFTESYNALTPDTAPPFGLMRRVDPASLKLCQAPRNDDDHRAGVCLPYKPGPIVRAHTGFPGPLVTFFNINGSEVLVAVDGFGNLPFSAAAVGRISAVNVDGSELPTPVLTGTLAATSAIKYAAPPLRLPRVVIDMAKEPFFFIDKSGTYRFAVQSFGLITAVSDYTLTVVGADIANLVIDSLPKSPQAYGEVISDPPSAGSSPRLLSVTLYDAYGNTNTSSGIPVTLECNGLARFLESGWRVTAVERMSVDGVADFSDVKLVSPPAFQDTATVVQALLVDGEGPDQGGWGMDADRVSQPSDAAVLEFKGLGDLGEIVLMKSEKFAASLCSDAGKQDYQEGDYAHPPGSNQPLSHFKYKYDIIGITQTPHGPVANITLLPPVTLSNAQIRQRDREQWPLPSPLEEGGYGICFKKQGSNVWKPQLGNIARFSVGPAATRAIVGITPEVIFPNMDAELKLDFGPAPWSPAPALGRTSTETVASRAAGTSTYAVPAAVAPNGFLAYPGDLVALRTSQEIIDKNCSFIRLDEVQAISDAGTIRTGKLALGTHAYHFCLGNVSAIGTVPPGGPNGVWPSNFSQQYLVRLSVINILNAGGGHQVGVYTNQKVDLMATTSALPGVAPATKSGAIDMQPARLPTRLLMIGPAKGSHEVRGVLFAQQPIVKVVGTDDTVMKDVTGAVRIAAVGPCQPQLSGQTSVDLVDGVATFTDIMLPTIACLGKDVTLVAQINNEVVGTAPILRLTTVSSEEFRIKHGAPHRVVFASAENVLNNKVEITRTTVDGKPCMPAFELGSATIGAIVRDAQGSPAPDYNMPIDVRLCDAPKVVGDPPSCPAAQAALVGTIQVQPENGYVLFNNFSVTNISSGFVLALYTPLLLIDYSEPFAACDVGVPQELVFVQTPDPVAQAAVPFPLQPFILLRDGFGKPVQTQHAVQVTIRVVQPSYSISVTSPTLQAEDDESVSAKLSGKQTIMSTLSDPLGLDEWNTTIYTGQHAVFANLAIGTIGLWRLHISSPSLHLPALSSVFRVLPGPPVRLAVDRFEATLRVGVAEPVSPAIYVRLFDAMGNNVTHENATAQVMLTLESEPGLNGGVAYGNLSAVAQFGVATFDNVRFDEAGSLKRLTASGRVVTPEGATSLDALVNDTTDLIQVLPGPPTQLAIRQAPLSVYSVSTPLSGTVEDQGSADAAALAASSNDGLGTSVDRIFVDVALRDSFGNEACNSLMTSAECTSALQEPPLAIALTLLHSDEVNYTSMRLHTATRTVARRVVFANGALGATFDNMRIYRAANDFAMNISLLTFPVHSDYNGLPIGQPPLPIETLQSSRFDVLDPGIPVRMRFKPEPQSVYMSGAVWLDQPKLEILDVRNEMCATFQGQVRLTISGAPAQGFFPGWATDGALLEVVNGTAQIADPRVPAKAGMPIRRDLRLVAQAPTGHERLVTSIESSPFDVFDAGVSQRLVFERRSHPLTLQSRSTLPFELSDRVLQQQPEVRVLDVNGTIVMEDAQAVSVQLTLEAVSSFSSAPPLYGGTLVDSEKGMARFTDVLVGGAARSLQLRATSPGLLDAVSDPFDSTSPLEPIALAVVGAPVGEVLQRDVTIATPGLSVEIVDALETRVVDAPTTLIHLCLRTVGHLEPCVFGARHLIASATAFAGYPGGLARFESILISSDALKAVGSEDGRGLFFEAAAEGFNPGRTRPTTEALPPGQAAQLGFLSTFEPNASAVAATSTTAVGWYALDSPAPSQPSIVWFEGVPLAGQPSVAALDATRSIVASRGGYVTLGLEMLSLEYSNETGLVFNESLGEWTYPPPPPTAPPPSPMVPPHNASDLVGLTYDPNLGVWTNATNYTRPNATDWPPAGVRPAPLYYLIGNATAELVGGVARFQGVGVAFRPEFSNVPGPRRGVFRLVATCQGMHVARSASFAILLPSTPHALAFSVHPSAHVARGVRLSRHPVISVVGLGGDVLGVTRAISLAAMRPLGTQVGFGATPLHVSGPLSPASMMPALTVPREGVQRLPSSLLDGLETVTTDANGSVALSQLNFSDPGNYQLVASSPGLWPAFSTPIAVLQPPAVLPCDPTSCQWAATASAGIGDVPPPVQWRSGADGVTLSAGSTGAASQTTAASAAASAATTMEYIGQAKHAIGPSDMIGCGLANEGRAWEPFGGSDPRWLLVGFAQPMYATGVAVYEGHAYGSVEQLLLIDEAGGYHLVLDQGQGDIDDADCLTSPLLVTFPPTQRRVVAAWILVAARFSPPFFTPTAAATPDHAESARLAQIDAVQLLSKTAYGPGAPVRAFVAARGAARLVKGMVHLTSDVAGRSGGLVVHIPSAYALSGVAGHGGGNVTANRTRFFRASFELRTSSSADARDMAQEMGGAQAMGGGPPLIGTGADDRGGPSGPSPSPSASMPAEELEELEAAETEGGLSTPGGLSFCYGELPTAGALAEPGFGSGLCVSFHATPTLDEVDIEARYDGELLRERARPPPAHPAGFAPTPICDRATPNGPVYDPPQCEPPPPAPPPQLVARLPNRRGAWRRAAVEVSRSGLSVRCDGATVFEQAPLPSWSPRESWGFSFGARAGVVRSAHPILGGEVQLTLDAHHSIANVSVERGAAVEAANVPLHVSSNGQQFVRAGTYAYHAHPAVSSLVPSVGPAAGGTALTLRGEALGGASAYTCRFALGLDPALETTGRFDADLDGVRCAAPSRAAIDALTASWSPPHQAEYRPNATYRPTFVLSLRVWRDGFEYPPRTRTKFQMVDAPLYAGARPASGPVHGGTTVHVLGGRLDGGWKYTCRFAPPAYGEHVPPLPEGYVQIERVVPASYARELVTKPGEDDAVACVSPHSPRLRRSVLHADYDVHGALEAELAVSLNAADYEANVTTPFAFYDPPGGLLLSATSGPVLGGTPLVISGGNLTGGSDRRCRFTPMIFGFPNLSARRRAWAMRVEVAATLLAATAALRCVTPALPELVARVTVEVSLNGQQFTREAPPFDVQPRQGAAPLRMPDDGAWGYAPGALAFVPDLIAGDTGTAVFEPEPWERE